MGLQLIDETTGHKVLEISNGGVLLSIGDSAPDSVQILAICGNPIIKFNGLAYDNTIISSSANPITGSVTTDSNGNATVSTGLSAAPIVSATSVTGGVTSVSASTVTLSGPHNTSLRYCLF